MDDNKKGGYRKRDPNDKAMHPVTFKLRGTQKDKIDGYPRLTTYSRFFSDLVDDFFQRDELDQYIQFAENLERISAVDAICMIGNQIDGRDVGACLEAWLDGSEVPPIKATETAVARYKQLTDELQGTPGEAVAIEESLKMLELVHQFYFDEKAIHLTFCEMARRMVSSGAATGAARKALVDRVNAQIGAEYNILYGLAMLSPQVRFSTFLCLQKYLLKRPAEKPDWAVAAKGRLASMNQPWIDPETAHMSADEAPQSP